MTLGEALQKYTAILRDGGIVEAADEARFLICHTLEMTPAQFFAEPGRALSDADIAGIEGLIGERLCGVPSAYLAGSREFYGMQFHVDPRVLIPRPETEILAEEAIRFLRARAKDEKRRLEAADVGTGSGAIAVALAASVPGVVVYATDISGPALELAGINVRKYGLGARVQLAHCDLLGKTSSRFDLIAANLPYIPGPDLETLPAEIREHEPGEALDGGPGGTRLIKRLIAQAGSRLARGGVILLEIGQGQDVEIVEYARQAMPGAEIRLIKDLAGINRVVSIKPGETYLRRLLYTFIKYLLVGLPNSVIYFGSLYILTTVIGIWYMLSVCVSIALQAVTSFLMHRVWTWRQKKVAIKSPITLYRFIKYIIVTVGGFFLGLALIFIFTEYLKLWYMISTFLASSIMQGLLFLANNYWTWGESEGTEVRWLAGLLRKSGLAEILKKHGVQVD